MAHGRGLVSSFATLDVVAVAITKNLTDRPVDTLRVWDMAAMTPDQFVLDQLDLSRDSVAAPVQRIADS